MYGIADLLWTNWIISIGNLSRYQSRKLQDWEIKPGETFLRIYFRILRSEPHFLFIITTNTGNTFLSGIIIYSIRNILTIGK